MEPNSFRIKDSLLPPNGTPPPITRQLIGKNPLLCFSSIGERGFAGRSCGSCELIADAGEPTSVESSSLDRSIESS